MFWGKGWVGKKNTLTILALPKDMNWRGSMQIFAVNWNKSEKKFQLTENISILLRQFISLGKTRTVSVLFFTHPSPKNVQIYTFFF